MAGCGAGEARGLVLSLFSREREDLERLRIPNGLDFDFLPGEGFRPDSSSAPNEDSDSSERDGIGVVGFCRKSWAA